MRFTITALGGAGRSVTQIVGDIVSYLKPRKELPAERPSITPENGPERYYGEGGEEPGLWRGEGAASLGLRGEVDMDDFASLLRGRDPRSGTRLISAQGSAGRRPRLGVGAPTRDAPDGHPIYDPRDAATALGLPEQQIKNMLSAGTQLALARLFGLPITPEPEGSYLVPVIDRNGGLWVTGAELSRCEDALQVGPTADDVAALGRLDDCLSLNEAARLTGVTPRYLRRLAQRYQLRASEIDAAMAGGRTPAQAFLIAQHAGPNKPWTVTRGELAALLERRKPPAVRVGYDLTLTTEKSLSILALLAGPRVQRAVLDAIEAGNSYGIDWLERRSASARAGGEMVPVKGWTVASFRHLTSRALDPFAHHHNVIANSVEDSLGDRRALDARGLYRDAQAASALATAEMRYQLTATLGVRWRPGRKHGWEIDGIPDAATQEFSRRRNEIDDALRELEEAIGAGATLEDVSRVVLKTRPAKQHILVKELRDEWWQRARDVGLTPEGLQACTTEPRTLPQLDIDRLFEDLAAPGGICANLSMFDRGDLLTTLVNMAVDDGVGGQQPLTVPAERLEQIADGFLRSAHVVPLTDPGPNIPALYTTAEMLALQSRLVARYKQGLGQAAAIVSGETVDAALAQHPLLTDEQTALIGMFCSSGHQIQCAIGYPGAGKTTCMSAARDAWRAAGYKVIGAAVKGEAARTLGSTAGIRAETLAWYLAHDDPHHSPLDGRTVLIIDEATTVSDRDLDRICWLADQTGATLRLIGDPAQHGAVEAGGMFRVLCERHARATPQLTQTHRLQDPHDRAAADHLRRGDIAAALDELRAAGHLHVVDDELQAYTHVLSRWWTAQQAGEHHPMVARRNSVRRGLNRLAHTLLKVNGALDPNEVSASGERLYAPGDRIIARAPNRDLYPPGQPAAYIRNGATATITAIHFGDEPAGDVITASFDDLGTIDLPRSFFDEHPVTTDRGEKQGVGIDHAYAVTSYAVTGATHPVSTSRIDETATRAETYVDMTRGRSANHLYLARRQNELDGEALPRIAPEPLDEAVASSLARSQGERTAWEIQQDQLERAERDQAIER